mmetsp:Transcript_27926/g.52351  ORF Transcript_27926/g.52351 Transcript_27926/m.52351 type:complete len:223 (-) Transcript_27926:161-829(-)
MTVQVHTLQLLVLRHAHVHGQAQDEEDHSRHRCGVHHAEAGASQVLGQQHAIAAINQAILHVEESSQDRTCETSHTMKAKAVQGVVNQVQFLQASGRKEAHHGANGTDPKRSQRLNEAGTWGDVHQPSHCSRHGPDGSGGSVQDALDGNPHDHGCCGSDVGGGNGQCAVTVRCEGGAAVEAQPAKPQEATAEHDKGRVGGTQILLHVFARANNSRCHVAGHP